VRLRYAYFITCRGGEGCSGEVVELRCTYDPETRGGNTPPDGRKVKATLHWVVAADAAGQGSSPAVPERHTGREFRRRPQPRLAGNPDWL
jgi:hypothetical protein